MLLSEDEAKARWCPFAREALPAGSVRARPDLGEGIVEHLPQALCGNRPETEGSKCIASECMAWREAVPASDPLNYGGEIKYAKPAKGFCGLAGKPE